MEKAGKAGKQEKTSRMPDSEPGLAGIRREMFMEYMYG